MAAARTMLRGTTASISARRDGVGVDADVAGDEFTGVLQRAQRLQAGLGGGHRHRNNLSLEAFSCS
jgi:hypothetical protein